MSVGVPAPPDDLGRCSLSPRELQIARLAARGRNNPEIALQLGLARETVKQTLRRAFRKLDARGRAQMAAKLVSSGMCIACHTVRGVPTMQATMRSGLSNAAPCACVSE